MAPLLIGASGVQVNLWLGRKGIVTATHYDASHNFFFQLHGRKRFTLMPPNASNWLREYPCLHPHIHHSQIDPTARSSEPGGGDGGGGGGGADDGGVQVVELGRGDMLVLPPFWWHHVETLTDNAVSINAWSDAPDYTTLHGVYDLPIPLESEWGLDLLALAATTYIQQLVAAALGDADDHHPHNHYHGHRGDGGATSTTFVRRLWARRWKAIIESKEIDGGDPETIAKIEAACRKVTSAVHTKSNVDDDYGATPRNGIAARIPESVAAKLGAGSKRAAKLFLTMKDRGVRELCIGNYAEHVGAAAFGVDGGGVNAFLKTCF